jgi:predicted MFS family arabinose efflux permease
MHSVVDKRMLFLAPEILWSGMSLAIFTGLLVLTISESVKGNDNDKMMKSMLAMVSLGFGEIVGSLSIGQVIDRAGNKTTSVITLMLIIVQTVLTLSFVRSGTYGFLVFVMMFVWGLQDSVVNTHISEILGFEFEDNTRSFSVFNIIQSVGIFTYLTSEAYVKS